MQARAMRASDITAEVVERFARCEDPRLRELSQSLVRHLHDFAVDVSLTQDEWKGAILILTATGSITDGRRQEFVLWSDALGLSMLVDAIANPLAEGATESTVLGPFYVAGAPLRGYGESIALEPAGVPAWVHGRALDLDGAPIAGAELDVWQNGDNELYAVQDADAEEDHLRGRARATTGRMPSSVCGRRPTRSRTTAPWATCSPRRDGTRGAPPTST